MFIILVSPVLCMFETFIIKSLKEKLPISIFKVLSAVKAWQLKTKFLNFFSNNALFMLNRSVKFSVYKRENRTWGTGACSLNEESQSYYPCWPSSTFVIFLIKELTFVKEKIYRQYICTVLVSTGNISVYPQSSMINLLSLLVSSPVTSNHLPL